MINPTFCLFGVSHFVAMLMVLLPPFALAVDAPSAVLRVTDQTASPLRSGANSDLGTWGVLRSKAARAVQVTSIAAGPEHSLVLKADGSVVGWGYNIVGQTDTPSELGLVSSIAAGGLYSLALSPAGTLTGWGFTYQGRLPPPPISDVVSISAGDDHALALKKNGTVVAWGNNTEGQCNIPTGLSNVIAVAAGGKHSLALRADGTIAAWGDNRAGQCNPPVDAVNVVAIAAGQWHSAALLADGSVRFWDRYMNNWPLGNRINPSSLRDVVAISTGGYSVIALRRGGTVVGWGGYEGYVPSGLKQVVSISAGYVRAMAMHGDGSVTNWDDPDYFTLWPNMPSELASAEEGPAEAYTHLGYLENIGTDILTDVRGVIEGPDADQFSVLMTQVTNIARSGESSFAIRFYPTRVGPLSATLKIFSNAPDSPFVLPLRGIGNLEVTATNANQNTPSSFTYGPVRLDRQTGLLLQAIRFTNTLKTSLYGLRLFLSKLPAGVHVYSSSQGDKPGTLEVLYSSAIAPGEIISFDLVYLDSKRRRTSIFPEIKAEALLEPVSDSAPVVGQLVPLSRVHVMNQGPLLEWKSVPRATYVVEYSDDRGVSWLSAVHRLQAGASRTFWLDLGQPQTKTDPIINLLARTTQRQYRIKRL
jgi:hypothetical protein